MEKKKQDVLVSRTFTWKIENFSKLNEKYYSDMFVLSSFKWRILIYPKGNNVDYLSLFLDVADAQELSCGWTRYAKLCLTLVNQFDTNKSITRDTDHEFKTKASDWGFESFISLSELHEKSAGYLVNDTCIVEAKVWIRKDDIILLQKESGELIDFRGLGRIDLAFHPLLEEVCLSHPSLIECQKKRSRTFAECAFTTLGRLLHFLKTTKVKDMTPDGYERLQIMWDELENFKFDLGWLQPHVHSILFMKTMAGRVERMRQDVNLLESEIASRRAILEAAEVHLEKTKGELTKTLEGCSKLGDMDSELGYPIL